MTSATVELYARHVNPAFVRVLGTLGFGRVFVRASGTRLWDEDGREVLDFLAGFGSTNLGHDPPQIVRALQAGLLAGEPSVIHVGPARPAAELAAELAALVPALPLVVLAQSGGEAVEATLKIARAATGRAGLLFCDGGFHGTGLGALSVMGHARMRAPFEPLLPECESVPFGDTGALARALATRRFAALLAEPIQAEGGVVLPPSGYWADVRALCDRHGTLLVLDEVQTGLGRTGKMFAFQHAGVVPDLLVLGKSLGGSLVPISAVMTTAEIHGRALGSAEAFDLCSTTFSGYALGCRAAIATLRVLEEERLPERAAAGGARLMAGLRARLGGHPLVREVRGQGLLVGIEIGPAGRGLIDRAVGAISDRAFGQWLAVRMLEEGILCQPSSQRWSVLRLSPPLIVTDEEIDRVVDTLGRILDEYTSIGPLALDVGRRLGRQLGRGWRIE